MSLFLIGIGCGRGSLTRAAEEAILGADLIIGARRMLKECEVLFREEAETLEEIHPGRILERIEEAPEKRTVVLFSGDSGFYSGAAGLSRELKRKGIPFRTLPGISSVQLLSAALSKPWQDWHLSSGHGREVDVIAEMLSGRDCFFLTDSKLTPGEICGRLTEAGLGGTHVFVGEQLGLPEESIREGSAQELKGHSFHSLSAVLVEGVPVFSRRSGILDREVLRGDAPMTKQEVRAAIVNHLRIEESDTVWDIGAGTGSVSVALSQAAGKGRVYAAEQKEEAFALLAENRKRFSAWNLVPVFGKAPEALESLPAPDAAFLGGTGGALSGILELILQKNPSCRILVSAILTETLSETQRFFSEKGLSFSVTEIAVSESQEVAGKHMMKGQNPIWLLERTDPEGPEGTAERTDSKGSEGARWKKK